MTFSESIATCFKKYATFAGTAGRSEYWWFSLFIFLVSAVLQTINSGADAVFGLVTLLPSLAAGCRRLHDTGRSGWWQLLWLIPLLGWIPLIIFLAQEGGDKRA